MLDKIILNFNYLTKRKAKFYYLFATLSLFMFCITNAYLNPLYNKQQMFIKTILIYSFIMELFLAMVDGIVLSGVVKIFLKEKNFKNVFIGFSIVMLLINSIFKTLTIITSIYETTVYLNKLISILFMYFKCCTYYLCIKKNFVLNSKKVLVIGILLIIIDLMPAIEDKRF